MTTKRWFVVTFKAHSNSGRLYRAYAESPGSANFIAAALREGYWKIVEVAPCPPPS